MQTSVTNTPSSPEALTNRKDVGAEMHRLVRRLYPICRSITGNGVRETLSVLSEYVPVKVHDVATGTKVFDWTVPKEWNIRDAYIKNSRGETIVDFKRCNLHVVNYSIPVNRRMSLSELREHLFTIPEHPEWIPYRTSYYKEDWGFCLSHKQWLELHDDEYEVVIDASLTEGHLTYGEVQITGDTSDEILISSHVCHPALCNDNLSGIALNVFLAKHLAAHRTRYSYRMLFIPGTIGAITWLALNESAVGQIKHGLVLACVGDNGIVSYKKTRQGDAEIDRVAQHVLKHCGDDYRTLDFSPYGYDERQFSSPGFNLPVGSLMRTPWGEFPEYHTSADNPDFVSASKLADSLSKCTSMVDLLEHNRRYLNRNPKCEPQLGRRGLYRTFGGRAETKAAELAMLWVLNLSDGANDLLTIAERSGLDFHQIKNAAELLQQHELVSAI